MSCEKLRYRAGKTYAITINPNDDNQFYKYIDCKQRWGAVTTHVIETLLSYESFTWELYFECSEPDHVNCTYKTRVHAHGFINIIDLPQFLIVDLNRIGKTCDIKIKELKDDGYKAYCTKQQDDMEGMYPLYASSEHEFAKIKLRQEKEKKEMEDRTKRRFGSFYTMGM